MGSIAINDEKCKGCSLCVTTCPKKCITISQIKRNRKGYMVAEFTAPENCIGCAMCAKMCPDVCITVSK
ncbi:MAG: 4Fe-4S binding protein [Ruminococcus sp.]|nr:4Fe-4S binding protein [Ruminococcus sp.]